jgi:hypothetical protein
MQFWSSTWEALVTITGGIIAVALLAVLVSKKSATADVIHAAGSAFGNSLGVAVSPVTGQQYRIDLSYPSSGGFGSLPQLPSLGY